jgi:histidine triad (HIT) family protein
MPDPNQDNAADVKQQCVFCQIIAGKISSRKIYEDESCIAILDINPANPGHTLILPKEHYSIMPLMPEKEMAAMFNAAKRVSRAMLRSLKADGTNIFIANGAAAGQKAPHAILHVIPRKQGDGITCFTLPKNKIGEDDQEKLRQAIKAKVNGQFGIKEKEPVVAERPAPQKVDTKVEKEAEEEQEKEEEKVQEEAREEEKRQEPAQQEEEYQMFEILPPEKFEGNETEQEEGDRKKKKGFDLDTISKLFG